MSLPAAIAGEIAANGVAWDILKELVRIGDRHPGHDGERQGAAVIEDRFEDIGLDERDTTTFDIPGWCRGSATLHIGPPYDRTFEGQHELLAHPGTSTTDVTGPLVDLGYATPDAVETTDIDGAVVLASSGVPDEYPRDVSRMEKYVRAADAGAAGFVFRTHAPGALPPTGSNAVDRIPSVGVSREVGTHLERWCSRGRSDARLSVESRTGSATSRNIEGTLGPDTETEVLVTAHVDGHDISDGARDNGVGCALVVETARALATLENSLKTSVRFVAFGAEEIGLRGASHWVENNDTDRVKCVVNVDAAGGSRTLKLHTQGFGAIEAAFESATGDLRVPMETDRSVGPGTDAWAFARRGVPAATAASSSGAAERVEVESGRGWGHTHADSIDKLDRRDLRDLAIQVACGVAELADSERSVPHESPGEMRARLDDHHETVLRGTDSWPYR